MAGRQPPTTSSDRFQRDTRAAESVSDMSAPERTTNSRANLLRLFAALAVVAWFSLGSALLLQRVLPDRDGWPRPALFFGSVGGFFLLLYAAGTHHRLEAWVGRGRYAAGSRRVAGFAAAILVAALVLAWGVQFIWQFLEIITDNGR